MLGPSALACVADVTDLPALRTAVKATVARYGGIDAVVVNAAIEHFGTVAAMDPEDFDAVVAVDLAGAWRTAHAVLPALVHRRGYILFVMSLATVSSGPRNAAYSAAKAGVVALAKTLRVEVAARGVAVGLLYLGPADTETGRAAMVAPAIAPNLARLPRTMLCPAPVGQAADVIVGAIERRSVDINLVAPMTLVRRSLPGKIERGHGHLVSIASLEARKGIPTPPRTPGRRRPLVS